MTNPRLKNSSRMLCQFCSLQVQTQVLSAYKIMVSFENPCRPQTLINKFLRSLTKANLKAVLKMLCNPIKPSFLALPSQYIDMSDIHFCVPRLLKIPYVHVVAKDEYA